MVQTSKEIDKLKLQLDLTQVTRTKSILNQNQIQKLWNSTPDRYKYKRPAKGGGEWDYLKISYSRKVLDSVFGFNWDFIIETSLAEAFEVAKATKCVVLKGHLVTRTLVDGVWVEVTKTQFGRADVKFKKNSTELLDFGNDLKSAASDCLKKCASLWGVGADIYEADEFQAIEIIGSDENSDRAKLTAARVKKLSKELKVEEVK